MANQETTGSPVVRILREEGLLTAPSLIELRGACDARGRYDIRLTVFGPLRAKHLRNVIKSLEIQAQFLEDDEAREVAANANS